MSMIDVYDDEGVLNVMPSEETVNDMYKAHIMDNLSLLRDASEMEPHTYINDAKGVHSVYAMLCAFQECEYAIREENPLSNIVSYDDLKQYGNSVAYHYTDVVHDKTGEDYGKLYYSALESTMFLLNQRDNTGWKKMMNTSTDMLESVKLFSHDELSMPFSSIPESESLQTMLLEDLSHGSHLSVLSARKKANEFKNGFLSDYEMHNEEVQTIGAEKVLFEHALACENINPADGLPAYFQEQFSISKSSLAEYDAEIQSLSDTYFEQYVSSKSEYFEGIYAANQYCSKNGMTAFIDTKMRDDLKTNFDDEFDQFEKEQFDVYLNGVRSRHVSSSLNEVDYSQEVPMPEVIKESELLGKQADYSEKISLKPTALPRGLDEFDIDDSEGDSFGEYDND